MRRLTVFVLGLWAVGVVFGEALLQTAAGLALILAIVHVVRRTSSIAPDVRRYLTASVVLASWQLISPAVARMTGTSTGWPPGSRYGQVLDTLAGPAVAIIGATGVPWLLLSGILAGSWLASIALGLVQHFTLWTWDPPGFLKRSVWRVQQNFGTAETPRYAAGGFFFHRLRFAHGAIATLGPALALSFRASRHRWIASGLVGALLVGIYASFARAALGAALLMCVAAVFLWLRGTPRRVAIIAGVLTVVGVALSTGWRDRFAQAVHNLSSDGERAIAVRAGWKMALSHPWLGVGFGNHHAAVFATWLQTDVTDLLANDSHNLWLTAWVETGLVGLALLIWMQVTLMLALMTRARRGSVAAAGALLSLGGFLLLSLVHYLPFHSSVHLSFAFFWGLGLCDDRGAAARVGSLPGIETSGVAEPMGAAVGG